MNIKKLRNRLRDAGLGLVLVDRWHKVRVRDWPPLRRAIVLRGGRHEELFIWRDMGSDDDIEYIVRRAVELLDGCADREKDLKRIPTVFFRAYDKISYRHE